MTLQKYELGQTVWAFKQQGKKLVKSCGIIQTAELDESGFIFYKIAILAQTPDGVQVKQITANHASIASSESEIDEKMETYHKFQEEQKKVFEKTFGASEFEPDYIAKTLAK